MRFIVSVLATAAIFLAASVASATVTISYTGQITSGANAGSSDLTLAAGGDQVTLLITANNDSDVAGLTVSLSGDLGTGATLVSGASADSWFNNTTGKFGDPQGGISNIRGTSNGADGTYVSYTLPKSLGGADIINGALQIFSGLAPDPNVPATGSGALDFGVDPGGAGPGGTPDVGIVGAGGAHAIVVLQVVGSGGIFALGQGPNDGLVNGAGDPLNGVGGIQIGAVPEPGTALLMGLGLSGLSLAGRRRR